MMVFLDEQVWAGKVFNGSWVDSGAGSLDVMEPATQEILTSVGVASEQDAFSAATIAAAAQIAWAKEKPEVRAAIFRKAGDLWHEHEAEISQWIIRESGAIAAKAGLEVHMAQEICFESAALPSHPNGSMIPSNNDHWSFSRRKPAGVVSVIAPFNFPLILSIRSVAPALALGNAVLLKPDPRTPISGGYVIARIFEEAGLPKGLLHVLPGGAEVGSALVSAPEVNIVSFTGSTEAGRKVGELASRHLKRVHLELGGKNSIVVLPGADLAKAASAVAFGAFLHQGQICMAASRAIVHESQHDEFLQLIGDKASHLPIGDPTTGKVALGPIIDKQQLNRVSSIVEKTIEQGGILVAGGTYENLFYKPTVLSNVSRDMAAHNEEIFGPVIIVYKYSTVEEAIELASDTEYGLSIGILGDVGMAMKVADSVPFGIIHINEQTVGDEANIPFGGFGSSGNGSRFGGAEANIDAFTEVQWLTVKSEIASYPF
jgi:benzaldehyde dehydrogenase (NAD)